MIQATFIVEKEAIEYFASGKSATKTRHADFILTHNSSWTDILIHIGQKLRYRGKDSIYTYWNHSALIVNEHGDLIEAEGSGVIRSNLTKYKDTEYHLVRIKANKNDRDEAVAFATYALGEKYGIATVISIAISLLTGLKFSFGFDGQQICSGLVAKALERTTAIFAIDASHITPADLAKYYHVNPTANYSSNAEHK